MYRVYHSPPWAFGLFLSIIVLHLSPLIALGSPTNSIALPSPVTIPGGVRTTQQYIIYPGTSRQSKKYKFDLQTLVGPDNVEEYGTPFTGILFWLVDLDAAQVQDFCFGNPSVSIEIFGHAWSPIVSCLSMAFGVSLFL